MNESQQPETFQSKMVERDEGIGTVTPEMVEKRARELALADGRQEANGLDRATAKTELLQAPEPGLAPEVADEDLENIVSWDEPPEATGHRVPRVLPSDEATVTETLIEEGLEEADHDQRVTAARANPPEE